MKNFLLSVLMIVFLSAAIFAQGPPLDKAPLQRLETIKIWKLTEVLDLNEEQSMKFFPKLKTLEKHRINGFRERRRLIDELKNSLDNNDNDKIIAEKINNILNFDKKQRIEEEKLREEAMSALTVRQQAKYILFEERFGEEVKKIIKKLRRRP